MTNNLDPDETFHYELSKKQYMILLESKHKTKNHLYNKKDKNELILHIIAQKKPYVLKYELIKDGNNKKLLILRRQIQTDPVIEVLVASECFDVLTEVHLLGNHATDKEMAKTLKLVYYIPLFIITVFTKACNICKLRGIEGKIHKLMKPNLYIPKFTVLCTIISSLCEDNRFTHIVVCIDALTNYIILRPTYSNDSHVVAYDLLKIFFDFGLPENLLVRTDSEEFYKEVNKIFQSVNIFTSLPNILHNKKLYKLDCATEKINVLVKSWTKSRNSSNWAIGLKEIQWHMNIITDYRIFKSRKIRAATKSPYHAHFGFFPNRKFIQQQNLLESESLFCSAVSKPKTPYTIVNRNTLKTLEDKCICDEDIYQLNFKTCITCDRKCHFNCCVINVVGTPPHHQSVEAKCDICNQNNVKLETDL